MHAKASQLDFFAAIEDIVNVDHERSRLGPGSIFLAYWSWQQRLACGVVPRPGLEQLASGREPFKSQSQLNRKTVEPVNRHDLRSHPGREARVSLSLSGSERPRRMHLERPNPC